MHFGALDSREGQGARQMQGVTVKDVSSSERWHIRLGSGISLDGLTSRVIVIMREDPRTTGSQGALRDDPSGWSAERFGGHD